MPPAAPPPPVPNAVDPAIGDVLGDKYELELVLGEGGFASVYRARHKLIPSLHVAVKVLKAKHAANRDVVQRFHHEAHTVAALRNPHTVRIMDIGETSDGLPFIVMEYINGASLDRLLARAGSLRPLSVARMSIGILQALEEAHAVGVIHRDLKPGNVLVVKERGARHPVARVLDFGIARVEAGAIEGLGDSDTLGETIFCTPQYAAPEVLRGHSDTRTDLYALGHMMAEMLAGRPPYHQGTPFEIAAQQLAVLPVTLPESVTSTPLADAIRRAVAKPIDQRWDSAAAMLEAVDDVYQQLLRDSRRKRRKVKRPVRPAPPPVADVLSDAAPQSPQTIGMIARALEVEEVELGDEDFELIEAVDEAAADVPGATDLLASDPSIPHEPGEHDTSDADILDDLGDDADVRRGAVDGDEATPDSDPADDDDEAARRGPGRRALPPKQVLAPRTPALRPGPGASTVALRRAELSSEYAAVMGAVKARSRRNRALVAAVLVAIGFGGTWAALQFGDAWADPSVAVAEASALIEQAVTVPDAHRFTFSANVDGGHLVMDNTVMPLPVFDAFGPLRRPLAIAFRHPEYGTVQYTIQSPGPVSYRVAFGQP